MRRWLLLLVLAMAAGVLGFLLLRPEASAESKAVAPTREQGEPVSEAPVRRAPTIAKGTVPLGQRIEIPKGMLACVPGAEGCGTCKSNADCGDDGYCGIDWATRTPACIRSNCRVDADCKPGERCQSATMSEAGSTVTTCQAIGDAQQGAACGVGDGDKRCAEGLVCLWGLCSASCAGEQKCPAGYGCTLTYDGWACDRLSCDEVKCERGYTCREGLCFSQVSVDCSRKDACGAGQVCSQTGFGQRWEARCRTPCNEQNPCGAGEVCHPFAGVCSKVCRQGHQEDCSGGDTCSHIETMTEWTCEAPSGWF